MSKDKLTHHIQLNLDLLYCKLDRPNIWLAKCVNYFIFAEGKTLIEAQRNFLEQLREKVNNDLKSNMIPLTNLKGVPQDTIDLFKKAPGLELPAQCITKDWQLANDFNKYMPTINPNLYLSITISSARIVELMV